MPLRRLCGPDRSSGAALSGDGVPLLFSQAGVGRSRCPGGGKVRWCQRGRTDPRHRQRRSLAASDLPPEWHCFDRRLSCSRSAGRARGPAGAAGALRVAERLERDPAGIGKTWAAPSGNRSLTRDLHVALPGAADGFTRSRLKLHPARRGAAWPAVRPAPAALRQTRPRGPARSAFRNGGGARPTGEAGPPQAKPALVGRPSFLSVITTGQMPVNDA